MKKHIFCIFLITAIAGCKTDYEKVLDGEWIFLDDTDATDNYFTKITFKGDSVQLRDKDYIDYNSGYKIKNNTIYIGETESKFKILNDSTIELLNQVFARKGCQHAIEDYNAHKDIFMRLPEYVLLEDTGKIFFAGNKGERIENISIGADKNNESVLLVMNQEIINFHGLKIFLEVEHRDWGIPIIAKLFIDKYANMGFVDSVFMVLDSLGIFRLQFALGLELNEHLKSIRQLKTLKPPHAFSLFSDGLSDINLPLKTYFGEGNNYQQLINIKNNKFTLNGKESDSANILKSVMASIVDFPSKTSVVLLYNSNTTYDFFIKYLIAIHNGCDALRNELSFKNFKTRYNALNEEQQKTIRNDIPKRIHFFDINLYNRLRKLPFPYCG